MTSKVLSRLKADPSFLGVYSKAISLLRATELFDYLRQLGRARVIEMGRDANVMLTQAAWSAGFNECLELIMNFKDIHFEEQITPLQPLYGANKAALERGDLTQEEIDAINSGTTPKYSSTSGNAV